MGRKLVKYSLYIYSTQWCKPFVFKEHSKNKLEKVKFICKTMIILHCHIKQDKQKFISDP